MTILKRFEIWLLLGLMTGALVFALNSNPLDGISGDEPDETLPATAAETPAIPLNDETEYLAAAEPVFSIEKITVTPTQQGKIVNLTLLGQAAGGNSVDFNTDTDVILVMTESGDEVERFFSPFPEPAVMDAEEPSIVRLKYWLKDDSAKTLRVNIFDHKLKAELPK